MQDTYLWITGSEAGHPPHSIVLGELLQRRGTRLSRTSRCCRAGHERRRSIDGRCARRRRDVHPQPCERRPVVRRNRCELRSRRHGGRRRRDARHLPRLQGDARGVAQRHRREGDRMRRGRSGRWHGDPRGECRAPRAALPRARRAATARGARARDRASLRAGAGHRVGDRSSARRDSRPTKPRRDRLEPAACRHAALPADPLAAIAATFMGNAARK